MTYLENSKNLEDGHELVEKDSNLTSEVFFILWSLHLGTKSCIGYARRDAMN